MKSLYPISQAHVLSATAVLRKSVKHIFLLWFISFCITSVYAQGLVFQNAKLIAGKAGANRSVYRFPNVKAGLDALVTIKGRSDSKVALLSIDITNSGHSQSFQPEITYNGNTAPGRAKWYMDFEVTLVKAGTNQRMQVSELDATALDIDGNNDKIREFIVYNNPLTVTTETVSSLKIDENPVIDFDAENGEPVRCGSCNTLSPLMLCGGCSGSGLIKTLVNGLLKSSPCSKCDGTGKLHNSCGHAYVVNQGTENQNSTNKSFTYTGPTTTYDKIDTFATQVMVTGTWVDTDEIVFRIGGENVSTRSQGGANRLYSLWFKEFRYIGASMLPVKLVDWTAAAAKTGVQLKWSASLERNTRHFVVERSLDGRTFSDVGVVAAAGNSQVQRDYAYTDSKAGAHTGVIYYRLRTVDMDGKKDYSDVRTVRMMSAASGAIAISTYPNPTVNALNITVPANWQGKKVTFEIYNANGVLVKSVVNSNAGQVEQMQVTALSRGLYIVKATAGDQSASQRLVKCN